MIWRGSSAESRRGKSAPSPVFPRRPLSIRGKNCLSDIIAATSILMNREQWNQVEELYHAALERPAADRAAFLKTAGVDDTLRREVESLLDSERQESTVL